MADDGLSLLTDDEKVALVALRKRTIDADRYPLITPIERVGQWQNCPHHRQRQSRRAPERRTARSSYSGVQKHRSGGSSFSRATLGTVRASAAHFMSRWR